MLVEAAYGGHTDTVEVLLDRGADLEAKLVVSWVAVCCCATDRAGRHAQARGEGAGLAVTCRDVVAVWRAGVGCGAGVWGACR